ncbi:MAG: insulinase family protein [Alphaproteobacteria bacterium]|nr:insulinase family protein [Alphaproteobacteria bacterium]MBU0792530.1 insulinase family protein [Alphaproteobacteria bacterium]MBU0877556.1 insulinase family protein [Alphaproteobacteria bacterium]MBU1770210.1 insulinase family protein [Alphaproteobacteria bacterium]
MLKFAGDSMRLTARRSTAFMYLGVCAFALAASSPAWSQAPATQAQTTAATATKAVEPAPLADLIKRVDIPYEMFTLDNGLRVIVHTDRKAPVVGVTVYYRIGSKHEPEGKTGFAHLFEHLMFGGSENVPNFDEPLVSAGSTPTNGSTWFDRTNYVETVPTGTLDRALFMEADRMGRLLGAVTQAKLDAQRAVVQNEKRQGDNQPYGLVEYVQLETLLPAGHPYGHSTIGSMADLDSASLEDVKTWFRDHYGPNNAILVLAGDIDAATAREKVETYFGSIAAGPAVEPVAAPIPTLPERIDKVMKDRVATTRLYRMWVTPGRNDKDAPLLAVGGAVLGGLASSRLDNILVREEQIAVSVTAGIQQFEQLGFFMATADVKPGTDPALVSRRLDEVMKDFISTGPTADEVTRVATRQVASEIAALEVVGGFSGKASTLAEGLLYSGDPAQYKKDLAAIAAATPQGVTQAMQRWLTRPVFALSVEPGERDAYEDAAIAAPGENAQAEVVPPKPTLAIPDVTPNPDLDFPDVETATLSNGVKLHVATRSTVPTVNIAVNFDAGLASDRRDRLGLGTLMLNLLEAGTTSRSTIEIAEEQERLGASISTGQSMDRTSISLFALKANLAPSLDLLQDVIRNPAFVPSEIERLRTIQLTGIAAEKTQPQGLANRAISPLLYGAEHPYGVVSARGEEATVKAITRDDLVRYHGSWIVPSKAEIFVAGDITMAEIKPLLDARFGTWPQNRMASPVKDFSVPVPAPKPGIYLIDRPQSPQSVILGGVVTKATGQDDLVPFNMANTVLGDDFLSRLNKDIREVKGWSYGVRGALSRRLERSPYLISAPVQADKTGPAIAAMRDNIVAFLGPKGVTPQEFSRVVNGEIASLPGRFETTGSVLGQMQADALFGRPFNYAETLRARYEALTPEQLDKAARELLDPSQVSWVVVGDKALIADQLKPLGLPVTEIDLNAASAD